MRTVRAGADGDPGSIPAVMPVSTKETLKENGVLDPSCRYRIESGMTDPVPIRETSKENWIPDRAREDGDPVTA